MSRLCKHTEMKYILCWLTSYGHATDYLNYITHLVSMHILVSIRMWNGLFVYFVKFMVIYSIFYLFTSHKIKSICAYATNIIWVGIQGIYREMCCE